MIIIIKLFYCFFIICLFLNFIKCQNSDIFESSVGGSGSTSFDTSIEIPDELSDIPFLCYGKSNNESLYLVNNTYIYKPYSINRQGSPSYIPNNCSMLHDVSDKKKLSCCLKNNQESYDRVIDYIWSDNVMGSLISLLNNKTLDGGFKIVFANGSTPDLFINGTDDDLYDNTNNLNNSTNNNINNDNSENGKVFVVYDTRKSVRTCIDHLVKIQCFRCSQDHLTILRALNPEIGEILAKEDRVPLFYQYTSISLKNDIINGTIINKNITNGKPIALCNNEPTYYFDTLMKHCQYVSIKGVPINKFFKPVSRSQFKPPSIGKYGIKIPYLQEYSYVSIDGTDSFYVSNFNCFQQPIDEFEEPTPNIIVNKVWKAPLNNNTDSSDSSSKIIKINSILNLIIVSIVIISFL